MLMGCTGKTGVGKEESETEDYSFTVEQLGKILKAGDNTREELEHTDATIYGKISSLGENGLELEGSNITVAVDYTDNLLEKGVPKKLEVGKLVRIDGMIDTIELECDDEIKKELENTTTTTTETTTETTMTTTNATDTATDTDTTTATTTMTMTTGKTEEATANEVTTEQTSLIASAETKDEQGTKQSQSQSQSQSQGGKEETTQDSLEQEAKELGVDLSKVSVQEAPIVYRLRSNLVESSYNVKFTFISKLEEVDDETLNKIEPKIDGKSYKIPELLTEEELLVEAKKKAIEDKKNEAKIMEEKAEQAERDRLNSLSQADLETYIKQGSDGQTSAEPVLSSYEATPIKYFRVVNGNKLQGLTDTGKELKTIIVPENLVIESDSELWDDLKSANKVEFLGFKGTYFTATKVYKEESISEKAKREYNGLPAPYTYSYASNFNIKSGALEGCTSLKVLVLPYGVHTVGSKAFSNCPNLNYVKMPERVFSLQDNIFENSNKIVSLIMPVQIIQNWSTEALYSMGGLKNLIFTSNTAPSAGVLDEDMYIFKGCNKLERVVLSPTVQFNRSLLDNSYKGLEKVNLKFTTTATSTATTATTTNNNTATTK
jgi:hypothetical protein